MTVRELRKHETEEEKIHRGYRETLQEATEELWDAYLKHFPQALPQFVTVGQLLAWSRHRLAHMEEI